MDDIELTIENKLKDFRKKSELSQEELALKLGISRQSIIAMEQGRTMPSLPLAVSICRFFNAAFEDVFEFEREFDRQMEIMNKEIEVGLNNSNNIKIISSGDPTPQMLSEVGPERKEHMMLDIEPRRPLRESVSLREAIDHLFEDSFITPARLGGMPKIDIKDEKDKIVVRAELPGVNEEDVTVEILDNVMTISGEKKAEKEEKEEGYYYKESHSGTFSRSFTLPSDVKSEKAEAEMKNGVLSISVPKIEPKKAQKITIKK